MNFEKVKEVIVNAVNIDENKIKLDSNLESDLGLDSLDAVELGMALVEDIVNFIDNAN